MVKSTDELSSDADKQAILELKKEEAIEAKATEGKAVNLRGGQAAPLSKEEVVRIREKTREIEKRTALFRANKEAATATIVTTKAKKPVMSPEERQKMVSLAERDRLKEEEKATADKLVREARLAVIELKKQIRLKEEEQASADKLVREARLAEEEKKQAKFQEEKANSLRIDIAAALDRQVSSSPTAVNRPLSASTFNVGDSKQQAATSVNLTDNSPSRVIKVVRGADASSVITNVTVGDDRAVVTEGTVASRIKALNAKKTPSK